MLSNGQRSKPQQLSELTRYLERIKEQIQASAGASLIVQNDTVIYEWYSGTHSHDPNSRKVDEQSQFNVASIRKTYLGLIISLALYEKKIHSLDDEIARYLPEKNSEWLGTTTIRHLLTHTHGLIQEHEHRAFSPGAGWQYNNMGVNLLVALVERIYGQNYVQLLHELVLQPYGFKETGWRTAKEEQLIWLDHSYTTTNGTQSNLFVSARDLAKWGLLHLYKGLPQSYLPQQVFHQATTIVSPSIASELPRNGFFWFVQDQPRLRSEIGDSLPPETFQSLGITGCACLVIPAIHTVAVRMFNQNTANPAEYDYLSDIKRFGDMVYQACTTSDSIN